jgi:1-deoxy-D-xylulose-5-phosphate synthase
VVAIYSTFLQRAYDQLIHDIALQNLPVLLAIDRAGLVGSDGPTHAGSYDISYLRCVPNMLLMAPADENECRQMLTTGFLHNGPAAVRYPRGCGPGTAIEASLHVVEIGKGEIRRHAGLHSKRVAILAFGSMLAPALQAGEKMDATVANMRFIKPLDVALLKKLAAEHELLVTVEENAIQGGAGSAVAEALIGEGITCKLLQLGLPDYFIEHGTPEQLLAACGLNADGIVSAIEKTLS